jgi:hypothetical protein
MRRLVLLVLLLLPTCGGGPTTQDGTVYSDVWGRNVAAGAEFVPIGRWPSQLDDTKLVAACAEGGVFYGDRCWDSLVIDVDARSVTFTVGSEAETIALGAPAPSVGLVFQEERDDLRDGARVKFFGQHHENVGYVLQEHCPDSQGLVSFDLWDWLLPVPTSVAASYTITRSPWVTGSCFEVDATTGALRAFSVRSTFFYGFRATSKSHYEMVHSWEYRGHLRISGHDLPFPVRLADVTAVTGLPEDAYHQITLPGGSIRLTGNAALFEARNTYGRPGSLIDLVTNVEFHTTRIPD